MHLAEEPFWLASPVTGNLLFVAAKQTGERKCYEPM